MNEKKIDLILQCQSILLSDPDGDNGQVRMKLMGMINDLLNPKATSEDCGDMSEDEKEAYDFGVSRVKEGANESNCNFMIFSTPEKTKAWEKGVEFAKSREGTRE